MAMYKFHLGTQAQYDAAKLAGSLIANDLYFTSDTKLLYKGEDLFSAGVEQVSSFPATGAQGRIYVNGTTLEAKIWNGTDWTVISPAVSATLTADTAAGSIITAAGIRAYVAAQTGTAGFVKDVAYDSAAQKITITYADLTTSELLLKDLLTGAAYDAETATFTFTKANGEAITVNAVKENFLSTAEYDADTHILTLTLVDGTEVPVDLGELIDVYTGAETATAKVTVEGNAVKADVKVSTESNNALVAKEDGLFVAVPAEALIKEVESTSTATVGVENSKLTVNVKVSETAGNSLVANDDGLFVAETDLSNYYKKSETYNKDEVDAAINALHTWQEI